MHVKAGDRVSAGDIIGLSGNTGLSTGPHLHWEKYAGNQMIDPVA
jgi:murein DD-endopeptidase